MKKSPLQCKSFGSFAGKGRKPFLLLQEAIPTPLSFLLKMYAAGILL
jgi:hypothetical protein